jgi:succinoglycan biosynthesis protein ExoO
MSRAPLVSVVMANYNGVAYLGEAIRSVQQQTLESWELIVVDDASTDDSVSLIRTEAEKDPRIRLLAQLTNAGPAQARNRALEAVRGEWVAIFDGDDAMAHDRLDRLLRRAREEDAQVVADNQLICSGALQPQRQFLSKRAADSLRKVDLARFITCSLLYSKLPDLGFLKPLIKTSTITRLGLRYDERLRIGEDFSFLLNLLAHDLSIHIEPEPLYFYRKHGSSISHRISQANILAMIAADECFARRPDRRNPATERALSRRIYGLHSWLAYERMIEAFKAGRWSQGLVLISMRPHAWPLATRPLRTRAARISNKLAGWPWRSAARGDQPSPVSR